MTAEIAVLNKSAVALAADSAVTIGRGASAKIYNSVNKIFELHETAPVGIMVYGTVDFMGLPLETLIKQYRKQCAAKTFLTITEYKKDFITWLETKVPISKDDEDLAVGLISYDIFGEVNNKIEEAIIAGIRQQAKYLKSKDNSLAQKVIQSRVNIIRKFNLMPYCSKQYITDVEGKFGPTIDIVIKNAINKVIPTSTTKTMLHKLAIEAITRAYFSSFRTGIVIAGFGENETCPSLERFEMEGVINSRLKYIDLPAIDIGRKGPYADVIGFAQSDMIDRFLHGVDPEMYTYVEQLITNSIEYTAREIVAGITNVSSQSVTIPKSLASVIKKIQDDQVQNLLDYKKEYAKPIVNMIRHMPKQEISALAKALIDLTSLKRHVSQEQETVGGEVDVAVISKSEGFVWVNRKHYFTAEYNPRFFVRHYDRRGGRP